MLDVDRTQDDPTPTATRRSWARWLRLSFGALAIAGMGYAVWRSWDFLLLAWSRVQPVQVVVPILLWAASHFVSPRFAVIVLGRSREITYREALSVHALRLPAKYLPGGIWHMVGRVIDFRQRGHARRALAEFVLMENLVAAGFALGFGAALLAAGGATAWTRELAVAAVLAAIGLGSVPWFVWMFTRADTALTPRLYAQLLATTAVFWLLASTAFVVFVAGFGPDLVQASSLSIYGTYLFSWGAGFIAFFAPQGVGVFEFVAGTLLEGRFELAEAVALIASFRLVVLAGDILAWAVALVMFGLFGQHASSPRNGSTF